MKHIARTNIHCKNANQILNFEGFKKRFFTCLLILLSGLTLMISVLYLNNQSQKSNNQRILIQSSSVITFLSYLLDLVSSLANTLKIIFQLTALLFIITDLVNFWNLASIYIFLPIQIPKFAKDILQNVWTQFNLPILSFFNVSFDTITFKQKSIQYTPEEEYLGALELDISEIAFQPMFVLAMTGIQLIFLTILLRWIKRSFRKLRDHVSKGIKLEDLYMQTLPLSSKGPNDSKGMNIFELLVKNNKVTPIIQQSGAKQSKSNNKNVNQQMQQSMKQIFDHEVSSMVTEHLQMEARQPHKVQNMDKSSQQLHPQLKFMFMLHKIAQKKALSSQKKVKNVKHWSQTISIDQFQILSALLISFMPVIFLPLYNTLKNMQYRNLMEKINDLTYIMIVSLLFIYPFVYLTAKLNSSRNTKRLKKNKLTPKNKQNQSKDQKITKPKKLRTLTEINLKEEVFQTFYMFFMNITIPVSVAIQSNPVFFLSVNLIVHLILVASSIIFYRKKSCQAKLQKYNKTIQLFTFLIYHLCFCFVHIFNQAKQGLLKGGYITEFTVNSIDQIMGIMIVAVFAFGGLHEMLEFLFKIIYTLFKLIYMVLHVICGGYDIKELEEDMKKYSKVRPVPKFIQKIEQSKNSKDLAVMVRQQKQSAPKNTDRSLSELGIDFEIEIAKNQIIVNKMKIQLLKEQQKLHEYNQTILDHFSIIHPQERGFYQQNQLDCTNNVQNKMASTVIQKDRKLENKENAMAQSFPVKKSTTKRIKRPHTKGNSQLKVKNSHQYEQNE